MNLKTAAKVFTIIGMIFGCWMILPLIFGGIALSKMGKATKKSDITVWAVLNLLFCNTIGGILMLCLSEADFAPAAPEAPAAPQTPNNPYGNNL